MLSKPNPLLVPVWVTGATWKECGESLSEEMGRSVPVVQYLKRAQGKTGTGDLLAAKRAAGGRLPLRSRLSLLVFTARAPAIRCSEAGGDGSQEHGMLTEEDGLQGR